MQASEYERALTAALAREDDGGGMGSINAIWPVTIVYNGQRITSLSTPNHLAAALQGSGIKEGDRFKTLSGTVGTTEYIIRGGNPIYYYPPPTPAEARLEKISADLLAKHKNSSTRAQNKGRRESQAISDLCWQWDKMLAFAPVTPLGKRLRLHSLLHKDSPYRTHIAREYGLID